MKRRYELKQRAESQRETRRRIVEAALELHATRGPARTSVSEVARRAGVQRHTVYRHFPDERALGLACSGLYVERNPPPDTERWLAFDGEERLRRGVSELYAFYERNEGMLSHAVADSEVDDLTRELTELRFGSFQARTHEILRAALPRRRAARAALELALDFRTWQRLHRSGLSSAAAADAMVRALLAQ
jgi:AcrR family transcriptional regulator